MYRLDRGTGLRYVTKVSYLDIVLGTEVSSRLDRSGRYSTSIFSPISPSSQKVLSVKVTESGKIGIRNLGVATFHYPTNSLKLKVTIILGIATK